MPMRFARTLIAFLLWAPLLLVLQSGCGRSPAVDVFEFLDGDLSRLPEFTRAESVMFSSYDRTGGNDDGFSGLFSRLRVDERREHVLAEMEGPGCVKRIWMTWPGRSTRIRIYIDGGEAPAVDLPIEDFFSGRTAPFVSPFVDGVCRFQGVLFSYVPIPFAKSIRVTTVDGIRFYQINAHRYPGGTKVESFAFPPGREYAERLARAREALLALPDKAAMDMPWTVAPRKGDRAVEKEIRLPERGEPSSGALLFESDEPGVIRELRLSLGGDVDAWAFVVLRCEWDDEAGGPGHGAVEVPLAALFGGAFRPAEVRSVATLASGATGVLRLPMPFRKARLLLRNGAPRAVTCAARILVGTGDDPDRVGRLRAVLATADLAQGKKAIARASGRGHYVGTVLSARGGGDASVLEGDDIMIIDGNEARALHGTGTEDSFNSGWYFAGGLSRFPFHGVTFLGGAGAPRFSAFRFQLSDRVAFTDSLAFDFEIGDGTEAGIPGPGGIHQTVALWYQLSGGGGSAAESGALFDGWIPRGVVLPRHLVPVARDPAPSLEIAGRPGVWEAVFPGWENVEDPMVLGGSDPSHRGEEVPLKSIYFSTFPDARTHPLPEGCYDVSVVYARAPGLGILRASWGGHTLMEATSCRADSAEPVVISPPRRITWGGDPMPLVFRADAPPAGIDVCRLGGAGPPIHAVVAGILLRPSEPSIDRWLVAGPFDDYACTKFDTAYAPEREHRTGGVRRDAVYRVLDGKDARWEEARADSLGFVSLREAIGGGTHRIAYAVAWVWSPRARPALFSFGSDDGGMVWLNGRLLWRNPLHRAWEDDQDRFMGELQEGWNEVLVKVDQVISGWGFSLSLSDARGELLWSTAPER